MAERPGNAKPKSGDRRTTIADGSRRPQAAQKAIGNFLRAARAAQKLTQQQVAAMTRKTPWRLSRAAISAIERGQNFPGMEAMLALSNVLYVDPKELVERARMSSVVPIDVTGLSDDQLERRASELFWSGHFRRALSVYDALLEKLALESAKGESQAARVAELEIRRATTLKRAGALLSAIATAERAISLATTELGIQARAYVVLADLQCERGHLPLARDSAERAVELSRQADEPTRGWAFMVKGRVLFLAQKFEEAREAFLEARKQIRQTRDRRHLTHVEGDVAMCLIQLGRPSEARKWLARALELAKTNQQPALEASWLIEIGKLAFEDDRLDEAEECARAALRIAKPREQILSVFRAEWLRHRLRLRTKSGELDRHRTAYLRKLLLQLDQHEGIDEVREFKATALGARDTQDRRRS